MFCKSRHTTIEGLEQLDSLESHLNQVLVATNFQRIIV